MALSARNQLPGKVKEVHLGEIMARVVVKVGGSLVRNPSLRSGRSAGDVEIWVRNRRSGKSGSKKFDGGSKQGTKGTPASSRDRRGPRGVEEIQDRGICS
jgi:molybdopterin-binding protein